MTLFERRFTGTVIEWRGPAPFFFVALPDEIAPAVREAARQATYGWGVVPVFAAIDDATFRTSLFPRDGGYLLPLRDAVRRVCGLVPGDRATVELRIEARD